MMKYIFIIMTLLCTLVGCSKDPLDNTTPPKDEEQSAVTFGVISTELEAGTQTRATILLGIYESKLRDYNIFCYHKESGEEQHFYSSTESSSTLMLCNGDWDVFVFANISADMGGMTREEVENYTYTITKTTDLTSGYKLIMVHNSTITVSGDASIDLVVERLVARFDIAIEFSGEAADYKIISTEVAAEAATCKMFGDNPPASSVTPTFSNHIYGTMTFYVLENLQGVVESITTPEDKNEMNAPECATHIKIYVESATHEIVYTYYLGGNTINDFNVERNTQYDIQINITGMNPEDMRVESTMIPAPDPVYEIYGDYSTFLTIDKFHEVEGWDLSFEYGDQEEMNIELVSNFDGSNEIEVPYLGILVEADKCPEGKLTGEMFTALMDENHNLLKPSGDYVTVREYCCITNFNNVSSFAAATETRATVKRGVKYKLIIILWNWCNGYSKNDIRLFMERGLSNEKFVDLTFETTLDNFITLGHNDEFEWEVNINVEGMTYVDVEFIASKSNDAVNYSGYLMTEQHYLANRYNWLTDDFFDKTPLQTLRYPDYPAIICPAQTVELFPDGLGYKTYHGYARLQCGVSYWFIVHNTVDEPYYQTQQCITVCVEGGTPNEQIYYLSFDTKGD